MALPNVIEQLSTYIGDWLKGLQQYVDNLSPVPDADNSMLPLIGLPYQFDATALVGTTLSKCSNDYIDSKHGYGYQQVGFTHRVTLINNELRLTGLNFQGKVITGIPGTWDKLSSSEQEDAISQCENVFDVRVANDYPDSKIYLTYSGGNVVFNVQGHTNSLHLEYNTKDGWTRVNNPGYSIALTNNRITDAGNELISGPFSMMPNNSEYVMNNTAIIAIMNSDTYAQRLANDIPSVNRSTMTKVCLSGATYKLYYGDTYLIYVIDDTKIYTYYDMYDGTKTAAQQINTWAPGSPTIKVPTYEENKYGPEPGPEPYEDDPWHGVDFSSSLVGGAGAFAKVYYMTTTELANLRSWMASINVPEGFDPMAQIVSLSQVPVELSGDAPENVVFINSSAVYDPGVTSRAVDSGVATQQSMGLPIRYSLGSIDIERRMEERGEPYLDYSCQVELYLPLVGVFSLDTQAVMGRTIAAEAILDPVSGTLAAYAWVEKDGQRLPIAYGSTSIGVDLPVTAQQYSVARAALKQANAQLGTSLLSSALTMIAAATSSGNAAARGGQSISSGANNAVAGNAYAQSASIAASQTMLSQTGNVFGSFMEWGRAVRQLSYGNNTAISGSFGGSTAQWSYPFDAYVKIIRPRYEKPLNYNHTQGVPCVQAKKVGDCTGFIQCINVDVSGITRATDLERQAIQAALCNGVYAGGDQ